MFWLLVRLYDWGKSAQAGEVAQAVRTIRLPAVDRAGGKGGEHQQDDHDGAWQDAAAHGGLAAEAMDDDFRRAGHRFHNSQEVVDFAEGNNRANTTVRAGQALSSFQVTGGLTRDCRRGGGSDSLPK